MSRMRYARPTARNQKGFILRNARLVNTLYKQYQSSKVYTDWKYDLASNASSWTWYIKPLTDVSQWDSVMRSNITVNAANHTFVRNMQLTCNAVLDRQTALFWNVFLVRPRYPSANRDFLTTPLQENIDWIQNGNNEGESLHLNPAVFKVLAKQQFRLMTNVPGTTQAYPDEVAGEVSRSTKRWEWNLKLNMKLSSPDAATWRQTVFNEMAYYNKIYLIAYCGTADGVVAPVSFNATARFTAINVE